MSARRVLAAAALIASLATAAAIAAPTRSQTFFRDRLLADRGSSNAIKELLRNGGGFVERSIVFRDLTGDERDDAVVRVNSGGADGVVAVYVFSTDVRGGDGELRVVYRTQRLRRGATRVRKGVLFHRTSEYAEGDEPCCPTRVVETELGWQPRRKRFRVVARRDVSEAPPASR